MQKRTVNELREMFLSFFESKGHLRLSSAPLVPSADKSLLLINSGMAPLKKYFLGDETPPSRRVTTCQKCIRTPDIERVGKTSRHGTYFEMLGNFSFGDYFKNEAVAWAWEFFTEVLEMPEERLYVSVYEQDDEAYDIWTKTIGVSPSRMVRLGKEDNFWEHGSGPCGPCSEIYYDRGEVNGCGNPDCAPGCDCDRFVEVWNLVFTQFVSDGAGKYEPMTNPNIDTGMGLERLACVIQEADNLFEIDTVQSIIRHISEITDVKYKQNEKKDVSLRVIADHIRSTVFMIGDGIIPSNEGRGYVLRRLLRRAARHGKMLGVKDPFLYQVCETVIDENKAAYDELAQKREYITKIIKVEEENFARTVDKGIMLLEQLLDDLLQSGRKELSGESAFKLSDTYGFPLDLTVEIAGERGVTVNGTEFAALVEKQKSTARADRMAKAGSSWEENKKTVLDVPPTEFIGYDSSVCEARVLAAVKDGQSVETLSAGDSGIIVLDTTVFYAESGGQTGDSGEISGTGVFAVDDTNKTDSGIVMHIGTVTDGDVKVGDKVTAGIDTGRRNAVKRNHTAAHLLHAALREILGEHVHQAGQLVDSGRCRFDFSHFNAMTKEEIQKTEQFVNAKILEAIDIDVKEMEIAQAKALGAMALFGEKYGDLVRVVSIGKCSSELCGGTHSENTAVLGLFKIMSESSVAAGVRRIEAVTGEKVVQLIEEYEKTVSLASE
ncbi:MAG: alanine--tRNA ligase, partial [Oscillospiraceae bacterium]|nr:alanine--tRNA ligase [Oscillospiraceae bacterium]